MNWERDVVRRTLEGAGQFPGVQLHFLLSRLENVEGALPAIVGAIRDMGAWNMGHADALEVAGRLERSGSVDMDNSETRCAPCQTTASDTE